MAVNLDGGESQNFVDAVRALERLGTDQINPPHAIAAASANVLLDMYGAEKATDYMLQCMRYTFGRKLVETHATDSDGLLET